MKLPKSFYLRKNVVLIAKELLGKSLMTCVNGQITGGMIVETEAYSYKERGCHAYMGKMTSRNQVMFQEGGVAYVYLCYGVHNLFNVVVNQIDKAEAVLIRAIQPVKGEEVMKTRMQTSSINRLTSGPGKLTKALGIDRSSNGKNLLSPELWIEDEYYVPRNEIQSIARIGIDYAGEDANLPWRFFIKDNEWVSKF